MHLRSVQTAVPLVTQQPQSLLDGWRFWVAMVVGVLALSVLYDLVFSMQEAQDVVTDRMRHKVNLESDLTQVADLQKRVDELGERVKQWKKMTEELPPL